MSPHPPPTSPIRLIVLENKPEPSDDVFWDVEEFTRDLDMSLYKDTGIIPKAAAPPTAAVVLAGNSVLSEMVAYDMCMLASMILTMVALIVLLKPCRCISNPPPPSSDVDT